MRKLHVLTRALLAALFFACMAMPVLAVDDDDQGPSPDDVCAGLAHGAKGLCNAYCNAQDCPSHPERHSCAVLRTNFERQTGSSLFPCDEVASATATPSTTPTLTAPPPTRTPSNTPAATGSATAASTSTATRVATATATAPVIFTDTPVETATAVSTATATPSGVPTGTVAASCAEVGGGAEFVCETFCSTEQCPSNPTPFCEELRTIFASRTGGTIFPCEAPVAGALTCMGDCGGDGTVDIADLTQCLLIVFGERAAAACAGARQDGQPMMIGDMVTAVRHALEGCE